MGNRCWSGGLYVLLLSGKAYGKAMLFVVRPGMRSLEILVVLLFFKRGVGVI